MKRVYYLVFILFLFFLGSALLLNSLYLKYILSYYLSKGLNLEVKIEEASWGPKGSIELKSIRISNAKGLRCNIKDAVVNYDIKSMSREGINFDFKLKGTDLSYPDSGVINGIANFLSVKPLELFSFDSVEGRLYRKGNGLIIKGLNASGKELRLYVDGSITENSKIDCSFKMMLSGRIVANIPEATRKFFFKEGSPWSEVELHICGDIKRPSIDFSTDLFKLIVNKSVPCTEVPP